METSEYFYWQVNQNNFIEIKDGQLTAKNNWKTVTDKIDNYTLKFFKLSWMEVHFILYNFENIVQWDYRAFIKREDKKQAEQFLYIMKQHGLFQNQSTIDLWKTEEEDSKRFLSKFKPGERKCPECGSKRYHAFVQEVAVGGGIERTELRRGRHPLNPRRSVVYQKKSYLIRPKTEQVSQFVCDDCGKIF